MRDADPNQSEKLVDSVYDELHALAGRYFKRERGNHTLQPTALVHEAWMRLHARPPEDLAEDGDERAVFIGTAARVMRQVLVDHARMHGADKRGADWRRVTLSELVDGGRDYGPEELLDLDAALAKLESTNAQLCRLAELRLFGGLSIREAAAVLGVSETTTKDRWSFARAVLARTLSERLTS